MPNTSKSKLRKLLVSIIESSEKQYTPDHKLRAAEMLLSLIESKKQEPQTAAKKALGIR